MAMLLVFGATTNVQALTTEAYEAADWLTANGISIDPDVVIDSVVAVKDAGGFGDDTVLNYLRTGKDLEGNTHLGFTGWGASLTQTSGSVGALGNCANDLGSIICVASGDVATYTGTAARYFALHWGGDGDGDGNKTQSMLALKFVDPVTTFTISGINGMSFIRAYTPIPGALPLFGSVLALLGLGKWWRRRRRTVSTVAA
jgi:hypothetical protein